MHDLPTDGDAMRRTTPQLTASAIVLGTPVSTLYCPSRRPATLYRYGSFLRQNNARNQDGSTVTMVAKTDYAGNSGSRLDDGVGGGSPNTDNPKATPRECDVRKSNCPWANYHPPSVSDEKPGMLFNGIIHQRSMIATAQIEDGTSKTYSLVRNTSTLCDTQAVRLAMITRPPTAVTTVM